MGQQQKKERTVAIGLGRTTREQVYRKVDQDTKDARRKVLRARKLSHLQPYIQKLLHSLSSPLENPT